MQNKSYRKRFAVLVLAGLLAFGIPAEAMAEQTAATGTEQPEEIEHMEETGETEAPDSGETVQDSEIPVTGETENLESAVTEGTEVASESMGTEDGTKETEEVMEPTEELEMEETENSDAGVMLLAAAADFRYNVSDEDRKTIEITGYTGNDTNVVIPGEIDGYTVTGIGEYAFEYCEGLAGIEIPEGVASIGDCAFYGCNGLTDIEIPGSVTSIGNSAFYGCNGLTGIEIPEGVTSLRTCLLQDSWDLTSMVVDPGNSVYTSGNGNNCIIEKQGNTLIAGCKTTIIPGSVTGIGSFAFRGCSGLTGIEIPGSVTSIGASAFYRCEGLTGIEIPGSVTSIGAGAFEYCEGLTGIEIPGSVTNIGRNPFSGCDGLTSIVVDSGNTIYTSGNGKNCIIEKESNALIAGCKTTIIPDGVTSIGDSAFSWCSGFTSIEIPGSVTSIGNGAFWECIGLTSIEIPGSVTSIGDDAIVSSVTIYGESGSYAETWAQQNGNTFIAGKMPQLKDISDCTATLAATSYTYTGEEIEPDVTVTDGEKILENETDYTVSYENNVDVGTATVIVAGEGGYTGRIELTFEIVPEIVSEKDISGCTATLVATSCTYTGTAQTPGVTVKDGATTLKNGTDYTVSYANNTKVGTATVTITGKGNYTGSRSLTFAITAKNISACTVSKIANELYTGKVLKPSLTVKDGGTTLKNGTDYTVSYANNTKVGTATVMITGKGNYTGSRSLTFAIMAKNISACTVSKIANELYTGKALKPSLTVKDGGTTLKKDTDYTISYADNKKAGKATVTVTGKGNYTGSKTVNFTIIKIVSGVKAASAGYNSVNVSWKKVSGVAGYKVYRAGSKNGSYKCVKTVKGDENTNYKDGKLTTGKTYYYQVRPYLGKKEGAASKVVSAKPVPAKAAISSVKNSASKTAKITWEKVSGASGYEIYRATSKNGQYKKVTTIKKGGTVSYKNTKLKKGKTYYYKVRAYRTVNGKKVYGAYSSVKSVKIKK